MHRLGEDPIHSMCVHILVTLQQSGSHCSLLLRCPNGGRSMAPVWQTSSPSEPKKGSVAQDIYIYIIYTIYIYIYVSIR